MSGKRYAIIVAIVSLFFGVVSLFVPSIIVVGFIMFVLGFGFGLELRAWAVPDPIKEKRCTQ